MPLFESFQLLTKMNQSLYKYLIRRLAAFLVAAIFYFYTLHNIITTMLLFGDGFSLKLAHKMLWLSQMLNKEVDDAVLISFSLTLCNVHNKCGPKK